MKADFSIETNVLAGPKVPLDMIYLQIELVFRSCVILDTSWSQYEAIILLSTSSFSATWSMSFSIGADRNLKSLVVN